MSVRVVMCKTDSIRSIVLQNGPGAESILPSPLLADIIIKCGRGCELMWAQGCAFALHCEKAERTADRRTDARRSCSCALSERLRQLAGRRGREEHG